MNSLQAKVNVLGRLGSSQVRRCTSCRVSHAGIPFRARCAARDALLPSPYGDDIPQGDDVRVG